MPTLAAWFEYAGWPAEEVEPGVWHCAFANQDGATCHLYVLATDDWLHFAVSPLLPGPGQGAGQGAAAGGTGNLYAALLRANQALRLARLALDDDGDVNLLADLPTEHAGAALFAETLELLADYADELGAQLRRND